MSNRVLGKQIAELRNRRGLTQTQLGERIGMSHSTVASWEVGKRDPSSSMITKLADFFGVATDYLLGLSTNAMIENRLIELGMTLEDLSEKTGIPLRNLQNLDYVDPAPWDYEQGGVIDKLADALQLDRKKLVSAFARQEPPVYDGPRSTVEEDFGRVQELSGDYSVIPGMIVQEAGFMDWARENLGDVFFYDFDSAPEERKAQLMKDILYLWERDKNKK